MSVFDPPASWYEPPEPKPCCAAGEDDEDHDVQACLADSAEAAAEARVREESCFDEW